MEYSRISPEIGGYNIFFMDLTDRNGGVISTIIDNYRDIYIYCKYIYGWHITEHIFL
jgi:hypothetical protein